MNSCISIAEDSLDSCIEENTSWSLPLGNLYNIMKESSNEEVKEELPNYEYDSDETVLSLECSPELFSSNKQHAQIGSDNDTCLSSDSINKFPPPDHQVVDAHLVAISGSRIISSCQQTEQTTVKCTWLTGDFTCEQNDHFWLNQERALHKAGAQVIMEETKLADPFQSGMPEEDTEGKKVYSPTRQKQKVKRKRKARIWSGHRCSQVQSFTQSQSKFSGEKPSRKKLFEKHCSYMEDLNIIEAKMSSIDKLIALKSRLYVDQAKRMMRDDVIERIVRLKVKLESKDKSESSTSDSDSETEREMEKLSLLRKVRLNEITRRYDELKNSMSVELEDSELCETANLSPECSQSLLSTAFQLSSSKLEDFSSRENRKRKRIPRKVANVLQPTLFRPQSSVIYVPRINAATSPGDTRLTVTSQPNRHCSEWDTYNRDLPNSIRLIPPATHSISTKGALQVSLNQSTSHFSAQNCSQMQKAFSPISQNKKYQKIQSKRPRVTATKNMVCPKSTIYKFPLQVIPSASPQQEAMIRPHASIQSSPSPFVTKQPTLVPCGTNRSIQARDSDINSTCFGVCDLLKVGLVSRGPGVLSYVLADTGRAHKGSIVGDGVILSTDYQLFNSPMDWIKKISSKEVSRTKAYKLVHYRGVSLFELSRKCEKLSFSSSSSQSCVDVITDCVEELPCQELEKAEREQGSFGFSVTATDPLDDLSEFMKTCKIRLIHDNELFVTSALLNHNSMSEAQLMSHLLFGDR